MPRTLFPIERQLQTQPTLDRPARQAALTAVNDMMSAATRAGVLLEAARRASVTAGTNQSSAAQGRTAVLARDAYTARTNAEVAKYRAAYAIMAEEHGNQMVKTQAQAAQLTEDARKKSPLIEQARYHGKQREMMLQASDAAGRALNQIPPLPEHIAARVSTMAPDVGPGRELLGQPTHGWRPKKYNELMGDFYPTDVRRAAAGLSGTPGGGLGIADGSVMPTNEPWYGSLVKSIGFGVQAAGNAAQAEGNKQASQNPGSGDALRTGGSIVSALSNMLTGGVQQGQQHAVATGPDLGVILLAVGGVGLAGWVGWKLLHKKG